MLPPGFSVRNYGRYKGTRKDILHHSRDMMRFDGIFYVWELITLCPKVCRLGSFGPMVVRRPSLIQVPHYYWR